MTGGHRKPDFLPVLLERVQKVIKLKQQHEHIILHHKQDLIKAILARLVRVGIRLEG